MTPRCEIDLQKIRHNAKTLHQLLCSKGMTLTAVTKAVGGSPEIAQVLVQSGIDFIGDSHMKNICQMKSAGIQARFMLTRIPMISEAQKVVQFADISLNSEIAIIQTLAWHARQLRKVHEIILMIELGDLREGILPREVDGMVREILSLKGIQLAGIGTNLACFSGIKPDAGKMAQLSAIAAHIEAKHGHLLKIISGGNSGNFDWLMTASNTGRINNLRMGEALWLGRETLDRQRIPSLYTDAFTLIAEVVEVKTKPSLPAGEIHQEAFGSIRLASQDKGPRRQAIFGIGKQDVDITQITPRIHLSLIGGTSDHLVMDARDTGLEAGSEVTFDVEYGALLRIMTSSYVEKVFLHP